MTRVDFYAIRQATEEDLALFACRLTERIFSKGHELYLHVADEARARALDDLLWSFKPESFLPHAMAEHADEDEATPIVIGHGALRRGPRDVLLNLCTEVPSFHAQFQRIAEIIRNDEQAKQAGRARWNEYKRLGYPLEHHQL